jgi:phosphatidylglycerol---prolipoprotein diacylglyceryl transferase
MHRVLFKIGNFDIYTYGVMLVTGFLLGIFFTIRRSKNSKITIDDIVDFSFYLLLGGLVGARLIYVLLHLHEYIARPIGIILLREGGLAWHGALIGGFVSFWLFSRRRKLDLLELLDLCAPGIMLGLAVGRIGCFMNGCCLGCETEAPWGVVFRDAGYFSPRHPTQLYELVLDLVIVGFLCFWEKRKKFSGELIILMFTTYSIDRFIVEIFRLSPPRILGLSLAQYSSIIIVIITLFWVHRGREKGTASIWRAGRKKS